MQVGDVNNWVRSPIDEFDPNPIYMYFNCCNYNSYTIAVTQKQLQKKIKRKGKRKDKKESLFAIFFVERSRLGCERLGLL